MDRRSRAPKPVQTQSQSRKSQSRWSERAIKGGSARNFLWPVSRAAAAVCMIAGAGMLSGCVDQTAQAPDPSSPPSSTVVRRPGVSPSGATVSVASFSGGPQALDDKFGSIFMDAAKRSNVSFADPQNANYLVRGYLDARPEGSATAIAYVLDVFDSHKHRAQRAEGEILVKSQAADPWSVVDDNILTAVAAKSANDLAAVMTNTPEAVAAANAAPSQGHNSPAEGGQTAVAATPSASAALSPAPSGSLGMAALR